MSATPPGPLSGVVVVDLSRALAGPHAAMMLGDLGARVIKVETPGTGDDTRGWGPPFVGPEDARESTYFLSCNRNKESIALDLKSDDGRATLTRLVRHGDVLVENFRTGVLDRLGFSVDQLHELNPRLVVLSITGFGHDGPEGGRAGYDQIAQGEAGLMSLTGPDGGLADARRRPDRRPARRHVRRVRRRRRPGRARADGPGRRRAHLAARGHRRRARLPGHPLHGGRRGPAGPGQPPPLASPYGSFRCSDAIVQVAVGSEGLWRKFAPVVGVDPEDPRYAQNRARVERREELVELVNAAFGDRLVDDVLADLERAGVPAGEVRTLDRVYDWEQTRSQGLLVDVEHSSLGTVTLPGPPLRFDGAPAAQHRPPPRLDEHAAEVRAWLDEQDVGAGQGGAGHAAQAEAEQAGAEQA